MIMLVHVYTVYYVCTYYMRTYSNSELVSRFKGRADLDLL